MLTTTSTSSGKVTPVVAAAETPNVASPLLDWLREGDDEVQELRAELCAEFGGLGCCGAWAQWQRSSSGAWCHPSPPHLAR
jgi:hypothetical protein